MMKKSLLTVFALSTGLLAIGQCNQLFISEYVVGTGNNKAYELYNPTASPIDLSSYELQRWSNGDENTDQTTLMGTIPAFGTWVVVNGQTEDIDLGTFISPACDPELQALADQLDNPYPAPTFMNGDDALVLVQNGSTICDIFGKPLEDPGQGWTAPTGEFITDNQTMVRKFEIVQGVTEIPLEFLPMMEYDTLGTDNWSNLGIHNCACNPLSVNDRNMKGLEVSIYPNPVVGSEPFTVSSNYEISAIEVFDIAGRQVNADVRQTSGNDRNVVLTDLPAGIYIVNVLMENRVGYSARVIKN